MPKTPTGYKPPVRKWPLSKKLLFILGLLVAAIAIAIFAYRAYHQHAISAEKARFAQADQEIMSLAKEVGTKVASYYPTQHLQVCFHQNPDALLSPIHCRVATYIIYGVGDVVEANTAYRQIINIGDGSPLLPQKALTNVKAWHTQADTYALTGNFDGLISADDTEVISTSPTTTDKDINCITEFTYFDGKSLSDKPDFLNYPKKQALLFEISCEGKARAAYYSIDESKPL